MGLGAVVAIGSRDRATTGDSEVAGRPAVVDPVPGLSQPLEGVEILGRSMVERMVERFAAIDADRISVLVEDGSVMPSFRNQYPKLSIEVVTDLHAAITQKIEEHAQGGIDHTFIHWAHDYTETDLLDLFCFHRESRQTATSTFDKNGRLALWVVNGVKANDLPLEVLFHQADRSSRYFIREFVCRLDHPRDLRLVAAEMLQGRCETAPSGRQVRPGVWHDQGADVHRRARIVAPAYVGCGSKIKAEALITRLSSIERNCCVDSGTVVEDTSILANTNIGICLDLCHSVVNGNRLFNLEHEVEVEITDPKVMRSTVAVPRIARARARTEVRSKVPVSRKLHPIPESWQFDGNLIQE